MHENIKGIGACVCVYMYTDNFGLIEGDKKFTLDLSLKLNHKFDSSKEYWTCMTHRRESHFDSYIQASSCHPKKYHRRNVGIGTCIGTCRGFKGYPKIRSRYDDVGNVIVMEYLTAHYAKSWIYQIIKLDEFKKIYDTYCT